MITDFRGQAGWLIAIRAMVGTLLLGGATLAQITAPGSFAVHPFFWLIALTYGLTIVWAWCLRYVERYRWLVDAQAPFVQSKLDLAAYGSSRTHIDLVNTYVPHWHHG